MNDSQAQSPEESSFQKQTRLRRERRDAKIRVGGSQRLDKITSLSGRNAESVPPQITELPSQNPGSQAQQPADPDEVDISNHPYTSSRSSSTHRNENAPTDVDLRQLLRSGAPQPNVQDNPFAMPGMGGGERGTDGARSGGEDDPMMRMLQQMMGGMPGAGGAASADGQGGLPPGLAAMLGGGEGVGQEMGGAGAYEYMWKIIHAVFALALGLYITSMTSFSGARSSRIEMVEGDSGIRFFWVFATAELVLQSSRFFMERGKVSQGGMLAVVAGFLPEPWKGYVGLVSRYSGIYNTVAQDSMVVVFVLGAISWWRKSLE